jgi:hypothetical protein
MRELIDVPNLVLTAGEYIQDIRDRQIRLLGISALAGKLEDLAKPDYPAFQRARWSRIDDIVAFDENSWQKIDPSPNSAVNRKNKDRALIVGTPRQAHENLRGIIGNVRAWPAGAYHYRGVSRAGLLPNGFGEIEDYEAVAMLKGRNEFSVTTGLLWITHSGFLRTMDGQPKRADIKKGRLYLPRGVTVIDEVAADEIPDGVPLI